MRLSNGVARIESGVLNTAGRIKTLAASTLFTLRCKREDFKVELLAQQLYQTSTKVNALRGVDRTEVELRAMEIGAIKDAALVRRQEMKLRRDYAKQVIRGEIDLSTLRTLSCSLPPSSPSSASGS